MITTERTTTLIFKAVTNTQVDVVPADAPPGEGPKHQDRERKLQENNSLAARLLSAALWKEEQEELCRSCALNTL